MKDDHNLGVDVKPPTSDDITLCRVCYCMTKTLSDKCGKCGAKKGESEPLVKVKPPKSDDPQPTKNVPIIDDTQGLDEAIQGFRQWAEGGEGMDELDFKEYLIDVWLPKEQQQQAAYKQGYIDGGIASLKRGDSE